MKICALSADPTSSVETYNNRFGLLNSLDATNG
jgi:hypothetical protein